MPAGADVAVLWTSRSDRFTVNQNEFFNRSVGQVYYTVRPTDGGMAELPVAVDRADGCGAARRRQRRCAPGTS